MVRVLSDGDVASLLDVEELLDVVATAFERQGAGAVERPERPHFSVGVGLEAGAEGTGLTMPAYVHGADHYATKLADVHPGNPERGLPTVHAQIALTDARTGEAAAYVAGERITNARTGCIGGLAIRELAAAPVTLAVIGAGTQARWQARAADAATELAEVRVYSPSDSKHDCAEELDAELSCPVGAAESARAAVEGATAVVTTTTATSPVFPGDALAPGALVVAIGAYAAEMRELDAETLEGAARVFADVPEEVAAVGDITATELTAADLVPFSDVLTGSAGRETDEERLVVESVGSAVLDAAASEHVFERAAANGVGTELSL